MTAPTPSGGTTGLLSLHRGPRVPAGLGIALSQPYNINIMRSTILPDTRILIVQGELLMNLPAYAIPTGSGHQGLASGVHCHFQSSCSLSTWSAENRCCSRHALARIGLQLHRYPPAPVIFL